MSVTTPTYVARDWIKRARGCDDPIERANCLRHAEPLIVRADEWNLAADEWAELGEAGYADAARCAERAVALGDTEVSCYSSAARIFARYLDDPARARAILDQCRAALVAAPRERVSSWGILGAAYVRVLDDRRAARECFDAGLVRAKDVRDLCAAAGHFAEDLGDLDTARALIDRAFTLASEGACEDGDWWTLANAQLHALADGDAAWRTLEHGLASSDTVSRCLRVAHAIASHGGLAREGQTLFRAALARAEDRAREANEWLAIADVWREHMHEVDASGAAVAIRRCLEHAEETRDSAAYPAIAHRYLHLLDDPAASERLGPLGFAPAALFTRHDELEGWHADPARLLDLLRPRLTPEMLHKLSCADWGFDHEQHLAALLDIQRTGLIPQPLRHHPEEVLSLTRWKEGVDTDHVVRAFVCTVLCIDNLAPDYQDAVHESIAPLIESCIVVGSDALDALIELLVALCEGSDYNFQDPAFYHLGLLIAAAARDPDDPRLVTLAAKVVAVGVFITPGSAVPWRRRA